MEVRAGLFKQPSKRGHILAKIGQSRPKYKRTGITSPFWPETEHNGCWPIRTERRGSFSPLFSGNTRYWRKGSGAPVLDYCPCLLVQKWP